MASHFCGAIAYCAPEPDKLTEAELLAAMG
jgi:hypothetical protein